MKLIQQSAEIWQQPEGEVGIYKQVERAARLCYKSEDKVTEDSYKRFINMLNDKGHNSPFEHGTVYLVTTNTDMIYKYSHNPYSKVHVGDVLVPEDYTTTRYCITTNYRVIKEHGWEDDLKYLCEPTEYHEKRTSVHITTSRSISHELVRHRVFSFCQESQRYCNYSKDKFNNEITFIKPSWLNIPTGHYTYWDGDWCDIHKMKIQVSDEECRDIGTFLRALDQAEIQYTILSNLGWKPQEAREVLPNATKTELIMTGFESQWKEFFNLRCSKAAHPMMQELANQIKELI